MPRLAHRPGQQLARCSQVSVPRRALRLAVFSAVFSAVSLEASPEQWAGQLPQIVLPSTIAGGTPMTEIAALITDQVFLLWLEKKDEYSSERCTWSMLRLEILALALAHRDALFIFNPVQRASVFGRSTKPTSDWRTHFNESSWDDHVKLSAPYRDWIATSRRNVPRAFLAYVDQSEPFRLWALTCAPMESKESISRQAERAIHTRLVDLFIPTRSAESVHFFDGSQPIAETLYSGGDYGEFLAWTNPRLPTSELRKVVLEWVECMDWSLHEVDSIQDYWNELT